MLELGYINCALCQYDYFTMEIIAIKLQFMVKLETMKGKNTDKFGWNICGHENIVHFLQSAISGDKLAHAYLFHGASQLGKKTVAGKLISSLFCFEDGKRPCGVCTNCRQVEAGVYPDLYTVEREINEKTEKLRRDIVIEQVRQLKTKLQQGTMLNGYKVALISEANLLNPNAANALLKILEEPTKNTIIVLVANNISDLPDTIVSRCQTFKFLPVAVPTISHYLSNRSVEDPEALARKSYGKPGMALSLSKNKELSNRLESNVETFFESIGGDTVKRFSLADTAIDWQKDEVVNVGELDILLTDWQSVVRDIMLIKSGNEALISNIDHVSDLEKQADRLKVSSLKSILEKIGQARDYAYHNISSKSALENLIINL
jgi:DNA polymerase-3 subunit delta'